MLKELKKAFIIYEGYYDFEKNKFVTGGVQTYITNLINILKELNYKCMIYQFSDNGDLQMYKSDDCIIVDVPNCKTNGNYDSNKILNYIEEDFNKEEDLLIFADHILTVKNYAKHSLSIQHGIHWDVRKEISRAAWRMFLSKARFAYSEHKKMKYIKHVVCVDYNFLNWYRAQVDIPNTNFSVIPNFSKIAPIYKKNEDIIKIIFARRFVKHRGTRVFVNAIQKILKEYRKVEVSIFGRGPEKEYMHNALDSFGNRVIFKEYDSENALDVHSDKDIAIIPTVGSEGTSLSLLEAMSAQCAVVCTDVGGMTNIVLDNFNGRMVPAGNSEELYIAIKDLIENPEKRLKISKAAYETVKMAFSYDIWKEKWIKVIKKVENY